MDLEAPNKMLQKLPDARRLFFPIQREQHAENALSTIRFGNSCLQKIALSTARNFQCRTNLFHQMVH